MRTKKIMLLGRKNLGVISLPEINIIGC